MGVPETCGNTTRTTQLVMDVDTLKLYVYSPAFDKDCAAAYPLSDDGDSDNFYRTNLREKDEEDSNVSPHDVSKLEAHLYYFGIRGHRRGPKLIFRTSTDVFTPPEPEHDARIMQLLPVYEHDKLGKDNLWATIRSEVVKLLDKRDIEFSSVDLVRFRWVEEPEERNIEDDEDDEDNWDNEDDEDNEDNGDNGDDEGNEDDEDNEDNKDDEDNEDNKDDEDDEDYEDIVNFDVTPYGTVITTAVTIWVGVLPDTLTGDVAFHSSNDILDLLKQHGISDVEVAYRESVAKAFSGPELFAPVSDLSHLKAVIDPVTTTVGLPIAGFKTPNNQGTMGFYFRVDEDLYAVTARHVLFPEDRSNRPYSYVAGPKKEVVLMGPRAFTNFLRSIQAHIYTLNITVAILEGQITELTARSMGDGPVAEQARRELVETRTQMDKMPTAIGEVKDFFVKVKKEWSKPKDRIIGHVVWAPPISVPTTPHSFTKDVCVIKLNKKKFLENFRGNTLDLGPEIDAGKFIRLMYPRVDAASDFDYPSGRLLKLRDILSAEEMRTPNNKNRKGEPARYVIKRGLTTLTTIGCLTGFESHVRRYFSIGACDSVEAAIHAYDNDSGPFSKGGDSGSIIVDPLGKFVALLTGATGATNSSDITYATPMYRLWEIIKAQFPGANLYFEDN